MTNKITAENPFQPPDRGLSLYIHVPFCARKCNYCAFYSRIPGDNDIALWLDSIKREFEMWKSRLGKCSLNTCYVGGGTPSLLKLTHWNELITALEENFSFNSDTEVTVEANPNSLSVEQLLCWRDWRVTRVSIGVQSFDDAELQQMGRLHSSYQAHDAISSALASGFSVSADFIFGLPHQPFTNWGRTLKEAVSTGIHHISLYQLSLEKGTPWEKLNPEYLSDGYYPYRWAQWYLPKKNFRQYEISNFSMPGHYSRHNINYWTGGDYLGTGPAASGYISGKRYTNYPDLYKYAESLKNGILPVENKEELDCASSSREAAVLYLRMSYGIDNIKYIEKYGEENLLYVKNTLRKFPDDLYCEENEHIFLTPKGMRVANFIWRELI